MKRQSRLIAGAVVVLVLVGVGWRMYDRWYAKPRAGIRERIAAIEYGLEAREAEMMQVSQLRSRLQNAAGTTLGSDEETVSATLRTAVNEILASTGLSEPRVSTTRAEGVRNPAHRAGEFTGRSGLARPDFALMTANAQGVGSFEAVLKALATLQAQTWVHRLEQWSIKPMGSAREQFELTVEFRTIYFVEPWLKPATMQIAAAAGGRVWTPLGDDAPARYTTVLARAAFKEPPPPPRPPRQRPPPAETAQAPQPPAAPAYAEWKVTALLDGRDGPELGLVNVKSGETRTLSPGEQVLDATFVSANGDEAVVEIEGVAYMVQLGRTLAERLAAAR